MKRTKYVCPQCGTVVEERWWNGVLGPECPNCHAVVLETVKGKRYLLSFLCNFAVLFSGVLIRWFLPGILFREAVALLLLIGAASLTIYSFANRRLTRPFLAKEAQTE